MNDFKGIIEDVEKSSLVSDKVIKRVIEIIGQEKWQDINDEKSDICTTTGELVITLKRIPDLEKENAELKSKQKEVEKSDSVTELKFLRNASKSAERDVRNAYKNGKLEGMTKLAQAKKIIKGLLSCCRNYPQENAEKIKQAEQFIKEIEK